MSYKYYFVKHSNKIMIFFLFLFVFVYQRQTLRPNETVMGAFRLAYNERRFLALYVIVYLAGLFPVLKQLFQTEYVSRVSSKWNFFEMAWRKIIFMALLYSLLLSFGWYVIVCTGMQDFSGESYVLYMLCVFVEQFIGWVEIGMLEACIYIVIHNLVLSFIISDAILILMNLSLYVGGNEQVLMYTRLYDFMFNPAKIDDIYKIISIGLFHIVIISLLVLIGYELLKRHDFIVGGKREHAN